MKYKKIVVKKEMLGISITLFLLAVGGILGIWGQKRERLYVLERPKWKEGAREEALLIENEEGKQQEIRVTVQERTYTEAEVTEFLAKAEEYIKTACLGENKGWDKITENLFLETMVPDLPVEVYWDMGDNECFDRQGRLLLENIPEDGTEAVIIAVLLCQEERRDVEIPVKILPPLWTEEETWRQLIEKKVQEREGSQSEEQRIELPFEEGVPVAYYAVENKKSRGGEWLLFSLAAGIFTYIVLRKEEKERKERQRQKLLGEYPALTEKLLLFLEAGMSIRNCFFKLREEACGRALEEELYKTCQELKNGVSEKEAYLHFGDRIGLLPYIRLGALLSQNLKSGTGEILEFLERELAESFFEKKAQVKKQGEEIGVKLLLPMGILLLLTLGIIMIPAFLQF
ncbi:MAG: type II secretion system F family protein [Acetivibrio ethanolgignens]